MCPSSEDMHIRCVAHVINLVVQAFLAGMDEAEDPEQLDWYETYHKKDPIHYDVNEDPEQKALDNEVDGDEDSDDENWEEFGSDDEDEEEIRRVRREVLRKEKELAAQELVEVETEQTDEIRTQSPLKRLHFITTKIVSSPQRRSQFRKIAHSKYAEDPKTKAYAKLMVVRDVRTRWNYTHAMICRAIILKDAIDSWVFDKAPALRGVMIGPDEWKLLGQIADFLEFMSNVRAIQPFTTATAEMSVSKKPTLPFVLPLYEVLQAHLKKAVDDRLNLPLRIRQGAAAGLAKLTKYKAKAESNQYYRIGTMLHPYYRSGWFRTLHRTPSSQSEAALKAQDLFEHVAQAYHESPMPETAEKASSVAADSTTTTGMSGNSGTEPGNTADGDDWLASLLNFDVAHAPVLRRYWHYEGGRGEGPKASKANPLEWWKAHSLSFPTIARMARDFLAIPATSVSVERAFSQSRHICTDLRSSLKEKTIREALLSKAWIRAGLFDVNEPRKAPVKSKKKPRRKAKGARQDETEDEEHSDESDVEDQGPQHKKARTESKAAPAKGKGKATASKAKAAKGTGKKRGRPSKMDGFPTIALTSDTVNGRVAELVGIGRPSKCNQCIVKAIPCEVAQPQFNHYSVALDGLIGFACAECHRLKKRCLWNGLPEICDSSAMFSIAAEKDTVEDDISRLEGLILELGAKNAALESKVATLEKKVAAQEKVFTEKLSNLGDRLEVEVESVESKWETAHARLTDRVTEAEGKFRRLSKDVKVVAPADVARVEMKADSALKRLDDTVRVSESVLSQMDDVKSKLAELDDLVRTEPKATGAEASAPLDDAEERQVEEEDSPEDVPGGVDGSASKVDMAEPMDMDIETQPNSPSGPGSPVGPPTDDLDMDTESDVDDPPAPATLPPLQPTTPTTPAPDEPKPASAPPSPMHSPCQLSPPGPAPPAANSHDDIDERVDYGEPDD
ncbi:hypothetical protein D9613_012868 [Agrocybe pediades]|uniref:HAT C-terminal dimerisation domain-containing protein n=1 Tax=Agrocybe pediades TaxID=84607 RepID=A0A8H4VPC5_9AGAR|nr:hypothetical protein D9613_012868 [Agrocybe pediades]